MDYKIPEPIGDIDWGNLVVDILACNDGLESLKNTINQAIKCLKNAHHQVLK